MLYALLGFTVLWLNGRFWRSRWALAVDGMRYSYSAGNSSTLVIMWTGAFNDAQIHYERLVPLYQLVGDVYVVPYAEKRFNAHAVMLKGYEYARNNNYTTVVLVGASLGGEVALRFVEHSRASNDSLTLKMVMCDVPLGGQHLPVSLLAQHLVKWIHIGPLFNLLSPLVTRLMFKQLPMEQSNGVDHDHLNRHMTAMWSCKLSAIVEQTAGIAAQPPFEKLTDVSTVYLECANDEVIRGEEAVSDWRELVYSGYLEVIPVEGGHVQFVENHVPWLNAHVHGLQALGFSVG